MKIWVCACACACASIGMFSNNVDIEWNLLGGDDDDDDDDDDCNGDDAD